MFATHKPFYQHYQKHFNEFQQAFKYYSNRILNVQFKHFHKSYVMDSLFVWNEIFYLITIIGQIDQVSIDEQTQAFSKSKVYCSLLYTFLEQWDWLTCKSCTYFLFTCAFIPSAIAYFLFFLYHSTFDLGRLYMFGDVVARPAAARLVWVSGFIVGMPPTSLSSQKIMIIAMRIGK